MELTGKCKEDFDKWLSPSGKEVVKTSRAVLSFFRRSPDSMQYSVYVDFFDSVVILISTSGLVLSKTFLYDISIENNVEFYKDNYKTRLEARSAAIKKANEIYNSK